MAISFDTLKGRLQQWDVYLIEFEYETTTLTDVLGIAASAVSALDISDFPNQGYIETPTGEIISYDLKTFVPLAGASSGWLRVTRRGCFNTTAASAASGATIKEPLLDKKFWTSADHPDLGSDYPYLMVPKSGSQKVTPTEGTTSISNVKLEISDNDNQFSKIVSINPMRNRIVTVKGGFNELPIASFETEFVGVVRDLSIDASHIKWSMEIADLKRYLKTGVFTRVGKSELSSGINNSVTTIPVDSTDGTASGDVTFVDNADYPYGVYLKIDDEILGPVTTTNPSSLIVTGRGLFGTSAASHSDGAEVNQAFLFGPANPITLALEMMISTGNGTEGIYDTLDSTQGMVIPPSLIDVSTFETQRDEYIQNTNFQFWIEEPIDNGKEWIEKNILRPNNSFMYVTRAGLLSYRVSNPPIPGTDPRELNVDNVMPKPKFKASLQTIVNQIRMKYSKDPVSGDYVQTLLVIDADSISRHGSTPIRDIDLDGVHGVHSPMGDLGGDAIATSHGNWYRSRYAEPAPEINIDAQMTERGIQVGDLVALSWDTLPNWLPNRSDSLTGRDLEALICEVVSLVQDFKKAKIPLGLVATQYSWRKFGVIGPNTMNDWLTATDVDKYFAYICVTATQLMSDGTDAYLIWFGGGGSTDADLAFLKPLIASIFETFKTNDDSFYAEFHISTGHTHNGLDSRALTTLPNTVTFNDDLTVEYPGVLTVACYPEDHGMLW